MGEGLRGAVLWGVGQPTNRWNDQDSTTYSMLHEQDVMTCHILDLPELKT